MPRKPDDRSKDVFHSIDITAAEEIIVLTVSGGRRTLHRPKSELLVDAVEALLREYEVRRVIDDMPDLEVYGGAYDDLRKASEKLKMAITKITTTQQLLYFFLVAMPYSEKSLTPDEVEGRMFETIRLATEIAKFARIARAEVTSARDQSGNRRWYELAEGRATNWLYGSAIPSIFKKLFKAEYSISHEQESTSPGLRFAQALLGAAGLPPTSRSNLRKRLDIARHHKLMESAEGSHN